MNIYSPGARIKYLLIIAPLLFIYTASLFFIESEYNNSNYKQKNIGLWSLPPAILSSLAGEYKGITADLLTLEAGARLGTRVERNEYGEFITVPADFNCKTIYKILSASQVLDPSFEQTFIIANGWLPWDCNMVEKTINILEISAKNRPWDYLPYQLLAFNTYFFLHDYAKAGKILLNASKKLSNPPKYFAILGARLIKKGGETKTGILLLKDILRNKKKDDPDYNNIIKRLRALEGTLIIEQAIKRYHKKFNRFPDTTKELLETATLQSLPYNPYNLSYCINRKGDVFFDRPDCRKNKNN